MVHFREADMQGAVIGALLIVGLLATSLRDIKLVMAAVTPVALTVGIPYARCWRWSTVASRSFVSSHCCW
jgi:hypothetical protein